MGQGKYITAKNKILPDHRNFLTTYKCKTEVVIFILLMQYKRHRICCNLSGCDKQPFVNEYRFTFLISTSAKYLH